MRTLPYRSLGILPALLLCAATLAPRGEAQRIGLEAGVADIQNYDGITPSLGVSLHLPLTQRLRAVGSYSQWIGCDDTVGCDEPRTGYGNRSFNAVGLFRVAGTRNANASLGAGLGWYEMLKLRDGRTRRSYQDALTVTGELRRAVAYNSSMYLRGDVSFPTDDNQARWTSIRLGVDVGGVF